MKNHELLFAAVGLISGLGLMNYRLGRCYWRHETLAKWILSLLSATLIIASILNTLMVYCPGIDLSSPFVIALAILLLAAVATIYRYCFTLGDYSAPRLPDPNQLDEIDDIPPIPTTAK